jgi:hypothetical protein
MSLARPAPVAAFALALLVAPDAAADEPPAAPAASPPATPVAPAGAPGQGSTTVSMTSDREGTLLLQESSSEVAILKDRNVDVAVNLRTWKPVCMAPCTAAVDGSAFFRVAGRGVVASDGFRLPAGPTAALTVDAGSVTARRWGWTFVNTGILFALVGGAFILSGFVNAPDWTDAKYVGEPKYFASDDERASEYRTTGYILAPVGVALAVLGGILVAANRTEVAMGAGRPLARDRRAPPRVTLGRSGLAF